MITEHRPNFQNLVEVHPHNPQNLLRRHIRDPWGQDPEVLRNLIIDTTATLVALDTQTTTGTEFRTCMETIRTLFEDLQKKGFVKIFEIPYPRADRTALIITPLEDIPAVLELIQMFESNNQRECIEIDNTIIHFHIDTYPISKHSKVLATHRSHLDSNSRLMYGNGTNDVIGHASLASMLARLCQNHAVKMPVFLITSDEETAGILGGLQLMEMVRSKHLIIDWEPVAHNAGTYVDGILPSISVTFRQARNIDPAFLINLQHSLEENYSQNDCLPTVATQPGEVQLNLSTHHLLFPGSSHTAQNLAKNLARIAIETGLTLDKSNEPTFWESMSIQSNISDKKRAIIAAALRHHFPLQPSPRTVNHISSSKVFTSLLDPKGRRNRRSLYTGNVNTLAFYAQPNGSNVIALGVDEAGTGRHTHHEAVSPDQLISLLYATFEIHTGLLALQ